MPESSGETPTVLWLPSDRAWLDPTLVARNLYTQTRDYEDDPLASKLVAGYNVLRWAIGFAVLTPSDMVPVSPWPIPGVDSAMWNVSSGVPLWLRMPDYGSLVMGEWWIAEGSASRIRVVEIIRQA